MTFLLILASIFSAWLFGRLLVNNFFSGTTTNEWLIVKSALSMTTGFGITSIILFIWLALFCGNTKYYVFFEILLATLIMAGAIYRHRVAATPAGKKLDESRSEPEGMLQKKILMLFWALMAMMITSIALTAFDMPHGKWDAWAIWNLRARFLIRGGESWIQAFSEKLAFSHPDYPLLLPLSVMRGWLYSGYESIASPICLGIFFSTAILLLLFGAILAIRGPMAAILAAAMLTATPFFIKMSASQYADIPLAFFFLTTIVMIASYNRYADTGQLVLAGIHTGFAAWTKNEGLLFTIVTIIAVFLMLMRSREKRLSKGLKQYFSGFIPVIIPVIVFKSVLAPPNDLLTNITGVTKHVLWQYERYHTIASYMAETLVTFGGWQNILYGLFNPIAIMIFYALIKGIDLKENDNWVMPAVIIGMLTGYFFAYVSSPHDLIWHLQTSCSRLFLQLWPSAIFSFLLIVGNKRMVPD